MRDGTDGQTRSRERGLGFGNPEYPIMKNTGGEQARSTGARAFNEMAQFTHTAGCHNRQPRGGTHRCGQFKVKALLGAIAIHGGEQDFTRAECFNLLGPGDGINAGAAPPAMGENFPAATNIAPARINRDNDGLAAESLSCAAHQIRVRDRGGIDGNLIRAGQ